MHGGVWRTMLRDETKATASAGKVRPQCAVFLTQPSFISRLDSSPDLKTSLQAINLAKVKKGANAGLSNGQTF